MKKRILPLVLFTLWTAISIALPVDKEHATLVARHFWHSVTTDASETQLQLLPQHQQWPNLYVFTPNQGNGFVVMSADDCAMPILGYSVSNAFLLENMPDHVAEWLSTYSNTIDSMRAYNATPTQRVSEAWNRLEGDRALPPVLIGDVLPMLSTTWSQSPYYNQMCPATASGQLTQTGCTATATAQVMKYWNHPTTGYGENTYSMMAYGTLTANFGNTTYDWANMPNSLNASSTPTQVNAVATLMYHVGIAATMSYHTSAQGGSAAEVTALNGSPTYPSSENALKHYFGYSPLLHGAYQEAFTNEAWIALLQDELTAGRPIIYSGNDNTGGHCFVLDGYNNAGFFHVNWGWSGYLDGYFMIGALNPGQGGTGTNNTSTFNLRNTAIVGIEPVSNSGTTSTITVSIDNPAHGSVTGSGTYTTLQDTVTLSVTANEGYRFDHWNDGCRFNPRHLVVNGNDTLVAHLAPVVGDTIAYCNNGNAGYLSFHHCAIKIPSAQLPSGRQLKSVMLYNDAAGDFTVKIYQGGNSYPGTLIYTEEFHLNGRHRWETLHFTTPVSVLNTQNLWIVVYSPNVNNPCPVTTFCGNTDGGWTSPTGAIWYPLNDLTFMLRGIFANSNDIAITAIPDHPSHGTVSGGGLYTQGETAILSVTSQGYNVFDHWQDGNTDNPRTIIVSDTATYVAYFNSCTISHLPVEQTFNDLGCWSLVSADETNDADFGIITLNGGDSVLQFCSLRASWFYDQYLISPQITTNRAIDMSFYYRTVYGGTPEYLTIKYSTTDNQLNSFNHTVLDIVPTNALWDSVHVTIPANATYVMFHYNSYHSYYLMIDDIVLDAIPLPEYTITATTENQEWGTVTGGGQYEEGETAILTVIPTPCYHFVQWSDGCTDNPRSVTVTANASYNALIVPDSPIVGDVYAQGCDTLWWNGEAITESTEMNMSTQTVMGCDSIAIVHLTVHHSTDTAIVVAATGSYTWNGTTYTESGTYPVYYTDTHGCDSTVTLVLTITVGIDEPAIVANVYPNPATSHINVDVEGLVSIEAFTLQGQRVAFAHNTHQLDIRALSAGTYMLRITTAEGVAYIKIVKP